MVFVVILKHRLYVERWPQLPRLFARSMCVCVCHDHRFSSIALVWFLRFGPRPLYSPIRRSFNCKISFVGFIRSIDIFCYSYSLQRQLDDSWFHSVSSFVHCSNFIFRNYYVTRVNYSPLF